MQFSSTHDVLSAGGANRGIFQLIVPKAMTGFSGLEFSLSNAEKVPRYLTRMTAEVSLAVVPGGAARQAFIERLKPASGMATSNR